MSDRVSWIEYKGARILYADYSGLSEQEILHTQEEFKTELLKQAPGSVVTLSNTTNAHLTDEIRAKFKEIIQQAQGISKASAAVGITGFKKAVILLIKRDMYLADSLEEAKEWLAEQAKR